jgi:hypothetical protein
MGVYHCVACGRRGLDEAEMCEVFVAGMVYGPNQGRCTQCCSDPSHDHEEESADDPPADPAGPRK